MRDHTAIISRTYMGYRHQALYSLYRILECKSGDTVFRPEGAEDLDVLDFRGQLVELVQVKSREAPLSYSSLKGFLIRASHQVSEDPDVQLTLATRGPLGPTIAAAFRGAGPERTEVTAKLADEGSDPTGVSRLFDHLRVERFDEETLTSDVRSALAKLCGGIDSPDTRDLLLFWLYRTAEAQGTVSRDVLADKATRVGKYLAERHLRHEHWFSVIEPLDIDVVEGEQAMGELEREFRAGVAARFEHVVAGLDIIRNDRIRQIADGFGTSNVVLVRGASGQGKSALCLRYLLDCYPSCRRFQIRRVRDQIHALEVARALVSHADGLGIPMAVLVDVHPSDGEWPELVGELSRCRFLEVLVAIREEDFRRAEFVGERFRYAEVALDFDRDDAHQLYAARLQTQASGKFLGFEEAWDLFGGDGPLMEFTHLLREKQTLRNRLRNQVRRMQDEVRQGVRAAVELELVRLVSLASSLGARLKAGPTVEAIRLSEPGRALDLLEREYLLRRTEAGSLLTGLHSIRSSLLLEVLLSDPDANVADLIARCVRLAVPVDIGPLLRSAFVTYPDSCDSIVSFLAKYCPNDTVSAGAILQSLLWLGASRFACRNKSLVERTMNEEGSAWSLVLSPWLPLEEDADPLPAFWESLPRLFPEERRQKLQSCKDELSDVAEVIEPAKAWLQTVRPTLPAPRTSDDLRAFALLAFWSRYVRLAPPPLNLLRDSDVAPALAGLPLDAAADVAYSLQTSYGQQGRDCLAPHMGGLLNRYRSSTNVVVLSEDEERATASFIADPEQEQSSESQWPPGKKEGNPLHEKALRVVRILMRLRPGIADYGCQGYGHMGAVRLAGDVDDTTKRGMEQSALPPPWVPGLNSVIASLMALPHRPTGWLEFAESELAFRRRIVSAASTLVDRLNVHFRKQRAVFPWKDRIFGSEWDSLIGRFASPVLLPSQAVDRFGLASESGLVQGDAFGAAPLARRHFVALEKAAPYVEARNALNTSLRNFFQQSAEAATRITAFGKRALSAEERAVQERVLAENGNRPDALRLSLANLLDALLRLPKLQSTFLDAFSGLSSTESALALNREETTSYRCLCNVWHHYVTSPTAIEQNAVRRWRESDSRELVALRRKLLRRLTRRFGETRVCELPKTSCDAGFSLWLAFEGSDAVASLEAAHSSLLLISEFFEKSCSKSRTRHAVDMNWREVVVVPAVGGRAVSNLGWKLNRPAYVQRYDEFSESAGSFRPVPLEETALSERGIGLRHDVRKSWSNRLLQATARLSLRVGHAAELSEAPEPDELGAEIMRRHLAELGRKVEEDFADGLSVADAAQSELVEISNKECPSDYAHAVSELIQRWFALAVPDELLENDSAEISLENSREWATDLSDALEVAFLAHVQWLTLLDSIAKSPRDAGSC